MNETVTINKKELESMMSRVYNMLDLLENLIIDSNLTAEDIFGESETEDNQVFSQTGYVRTTELLNYFKQYGIDVE